MYDKELVSQPDKTEFSHKKTQLNWLRTKKTSKDMLLVSFTIRYGSIEIKMIFFSQLEFLKINCQFCLQSSR